MVSYFVAVVCNSSQSLKELPCLGFHTTITRRILKYHFGPSSTTAPLDRQNHLLCQSPRETPKCRSQFIADKWCIKLHYYKEKENAINNGVMSCKSHIWRRVHYPRWNKTIVSLLHPCWDQLDWSVWIRVLRDTTTIIDWRYSFWQRNSYWGKIEEKGLFLGGKYDFFLIAY